eukprot:5315752-Prymnesium_polylepis.1
MRKSAVGLPSWKALLVCLLGKLDWRLALECHRVVCKERQGDDGVIPHVAADRSEPRLALRPFDPRDEARRHDRERRVQVVEKVLLGRGGEELRARGIPEQHDVD